MAAATPEGKVFFFDPARARLGAAVTLAEGAALDNVLRWLEGA